MEAAIFCHFEFGFYLAEPLMVMIVLLLAISLVLLGRVYFAAYLPFGALRERLRSFRHRSAANAEPA